MPSLSARYPVAIPSLLVTSALATIATLPSACAGDGRCSSLDHGDDSLQITAPTETTVTVSGPCDAPLLVPVPDAGVASTGSNWTSTFHGGPGTTCVITATSSRYGAQATRTFVAQAECGDDRTEGGTVAFVPADFAVFGASGACFPVDPACGVGGSSCMALVDLRAQPRKTLRVSQLVIRKPAALVIPAFNGGFFADFVAWTDNPACFLAPDYPGALSWLLELDTQAGTLTTGSAGPAADPFAGYCYQHTAIGGLSVEPATSPMTIASHDDGSFDFTTSEPLDVGIAPVPVVSQPLPPLFPLRGASFTGTVTEGGTCIGRFRGNADELDPHGSPPCAPHGNAVDSVSTYQYVHGATVTAHLRAEDADQVVSPAEMVSLCVALTGSSMSLGDGGPTTLLVCPRDAAGNIDFSKAKTKPDVSSKGDGVLDSYAFQAELAAAAVKIGEGCD